jgi:N-acetyl sugar amidotransferase
MKINCKNCGYPSTHPFGFSIIENICSGCLTHNEKYELNWSNRYDKLNEIIKTTKNNKSKYDCIIPVIGDAEDYFVVSEVLKLKMNPLLVSVNSYFLNDIGWKNLHNLFTHFDLDSIVYNPDVITYKELIRTSMRKYNHMLLPFLQLHTSFPVHYAEQKNIPLIIWGANQSVEQVGKFSHLDEVEMSKWSRKEHDLFNVDIDVLIGNGAQVNERHLNYYHYPKIQKLGKKVQGIYLSNYIPWDPLSQNCSTINFGFTPQKNNTTFDVYERSGSSVYYGIHDLMKFERTGYRKLNDHVAREIRHKRLNSTQAKIILKEKEDNTVYIKPFFKWLGVTDSGYEWYLDHRIVRSKHLISNNPVIPNFSENILPSSIKELIGEAYDPKEEYIYYGKGIDI